MVNKDLEAESENAWRQLLQGLPGIEDNHYDAQLVAELRQLFSLSSYVARTLSRHPSIAEVVLREGLPGQSSRLGYLQSQLNDARDKIASESALKTQLRHWRHQQQVVVAWRDFLGMATLEESLSELSGTADRLIEFANEWLFKSLMPIMGTPENHAGERQYLVILAMGKLGGGELNFSSDIDLIFCYPEDGETSGGPRVFENQQFFVRLGQRLIAALSEPTTDGFAYRVDMRLRPYGDGGALAVSFSALAEYYRDQGREWERFALLKSRPLGAPPAILQEVEAIIRPFVYRRYIDFGVLESLRELKGLIDAEKRRRNLEHDLKLGNGGIREIEFLVQSRQMIRGGRNSELQQRHLLTALEALHRAGEIDAVTADQLDEAYRVLRALENRLHALNDQQTHALPSEPLDRNRLAIAMGSKSWSELSDRVNRHRDIVQGHFQDLYRAEERSGESDHRSWEKIWRRIGVRAMTVDDFLALGFSEEATLQQMQRLVDSSQYENLSSRGRRCLNRLIPQLLQLCHRTDPAKGEAESKRASGDRSGEAPRGKSGDLALQRSLSLLRKIMQRTAYLELLAENPQVLNRLVSQLGQSLWISKRIEATPSLLDELLFSGTENSGAKPSLRQKLQELMLRADSNDLEQQLDTLRIFKRATEMNIAAEFLAESLSVVAVGESLTELAEAALETVLRMAWHALAARSGNELPDQLTGFAIVGYGKAGSAELGFGSDLDLVFLHDQRISAAMATRLAQRVVHLLSTRTNLGVLYDVDARLRPSGKSGALVTTIESFHEYQAEQAWTWEHQALVRARLLAGDESLNQAFLQVKRTVLATPRDSTKLGIDVVEMRAKMRRHLDTSKQTRFDIKQGVGGLVDIEFLTQYQVLNLGASYVNWEQRCNTATLLAELARVGLITADDADTLIAASLTYRRLANMAALQIEPALFERAHIAAHADAVSAIWQANFSDLDGSAVRPDSLL